MINMKDIYKGYDNIPKVLKEKRGEHTIEETATLFDVTRQTYSKYENGLAYPPLVFLIKVCNEYDLDFDYLFGKRETKNQDIQSVMEITGLSEKAIENIIELKNRSVSFFNMTDFMEDWRYSSVINLLFESSELTNVLDSIIDYFDILLDKEYPRGNSFKKFLDTVSNNSYDLSKKYTLTADEIIGLVNDSTPNATQSDIDSALYNTSRKFTNLVENIDIYKFKYK